MCPLGRLGDLTLPEGACCTLALGSLFLSLPDFMKQTEAKNNKSSFHLSERAGLLCSRFSFSYIIFLPF